MSAPPEVAEDVELDLDRRRYIVDTYAELATFTYYELLGVRNDADKRTIKSAFFRLSGLVHPDRYFGKRLGRYKPMLEELFLRMTTAHDVLTSAADRKKYDAALAAHLEIHGSEGPRRKPTGPVDARVDAIRSAARAGSRKLAAGGEAIAREYAGVAARARAAGDVQAAADAYRSAVTFAPRDAALLAAREEVGRELTARLDASHVERELLESAFDPWLQAAPREHVEIALQLMEEADRGIAEAFAGLCSTARREEERVGGDWSTRLRAVLGALHPASRGRIVPGLPPLVSDLRDALGWALDGLPEGDLAQLVLSSLRANGGEISVLLYAVRVAVPCDGRRHSILRQAALGLYDLPTEDPACAGLLTALARPIGEDAPYRRELGCLSSHAGRALAIRAAFPPRAASEDPGGAAAPFDARRVTADLVKIASQTNQFDRLCAKLPAVTAALADAGSTDAVLGVLHGLKGVTNPAWRELAKSTLPQLGSPALGARLLHDAVAASESGEGRGGDAATLLLALALDVKLLAALWPTAAWEQFERSEGSKLGPVLLEAIAQAGPSMLPFVCNKLSSPSWSVVRDAVVLLQRLGAQARDLVPLATHPHEQVRLEVMRVLRPMIPDEAAMDIVAPYLVGGSEETRGLARQMLRGDVMGPGAVAVLEVIASDEQQSKELRQHVVETLGRCPHDAAATALFGLLQPRGLLDLGSVRDLAAWALRRSKAPRAATLFQEGLHSGAWRVRKACERAASGGG